MRSRETAEIIAAPHGLVVQTIAEISEVDVGQWEGRSWVEIAQTEPDAYRQFQENCGQHGYAGGENLTQVQPANYARASEDAGEQFRPRDCDRWA